MYQKAKCQNNDILHFVLHRFYVPWSVKCQCSKQKRNKLFQISRLCMPQLPSKGAKCHCAGNYVSGVKKGQTQNKIHRKQNTGNLKKGADIDNRFSRNRRG
jgi:hypothetical protein